jgi:tol-pal system protein YbgF
MNIKLSGRIMSVTGTRGNLGLLFAVLLVLNGCTTNPAKKAEDDSPYDGLYSGSAEVKRTHEAKRTAQTAEEAIALGDKALRKGELDQAVFQYIKAMELNGGGDATTLNKIGDIQNKMGNYAHAGQAYQLSLNLEPDNQHALEGLGLIQLRDRNYTAAKGNLTRALTINQNLWRTHNALGAIADLQGDHVTAQNHYRQSLLLQPNSLNVINNYGYSLYLSGDWNEALAEFRKALNISPDFERAWYNIGLLYARQGRFQDALGAFDNVMGRPQAYNDIGYICMINGDYRQAELYLRKAIKLSSTYYKKAHENLEKMMRLKDKKAGLATSRKQDSGRGQDNASFSEITYTQTDIHTEKRSGYTDAVSDNRVVTAPTVNAVTRDSPGGTEEIQHPGNIPSAPAIDTEQANSRDSPAGLWENPGSENSTPNSSPATVSKDSIQDPETPEPHTGPADVPDNSIASVNPEPVTDSIITRGPESAVPDIGETAEAEFSDTISRPARSVDDKKPVLPMPARRMGEQMKYREALLKLNRKQFADAENAFQGFLQAYPGSQYADNASYWLGEIYYINEEYEKALKVFNNIVGNYPKSPVLADAHLKIGYLHFHNQNWLEARQELSQVLAEYPGSEAAQLAELHLKRMNREGR